MLRTNPFDPLPKRRWKKGQPMGRTQHEQRYGDLLTWYHPTKGFRSRRWPRQLPNRVDKRIMWSFIGTTIKRAQWPLSAHEGGSE